MPASRKSSIVSRSILSLAPRRTANASRPSLPPTSVDSVLSTVVLIRTLNDDPLLLDVEASKISVAPIVAAPPRRRRAASQSF